MNAEFYTKKIKELNKQYKEAWDIIRKNNIIPKADKWDVDLKLILDSIFKLIEHRIHCKLALNAINMSYTSYNVLCENVNYRTIYLLDENTKFKNLLIGIKTIPADKKKSKKCMVKEFMSEQDIKRMLVVINNNIKQATDQLKTYNSDHMFVDDYLFN